VHCNSRQRTVPLRASILQGLGSPLHDIPPSFVGEQSGVHQYRSRARSQVSFISSPCPGQHRRLRPFSASTQQSADFFVKIAVRDSEQSRLGNPIRNTWEAHSCRSSTGWRLHSLWHCASSSRSPMQRHDVENVASAGANPAASTNFRESKPQQTGTRLLPGYGEVATTSGSTSFSGRKKVE
jgi:hypothetical protein